MADKVSRVRWTLRLTSSLVAVAIPMATVVPQAAADAVEDVVTYEVVSNVAEPVNIEYQSVDGRAFLGAVLLPWRMEAPVKDVFGPPPDGSQVRADWRWRAWPGRWVTVRIIHQGRVICQSTLDVGSSTCYGITSRIS